MWIKWYPMQWLHSTCRDEMTAAQRATFQDFVCLAAISPTPGSFKFLSHEALARTLNTPMATIKATMDICLAKNRITLKNEQEGLVCTIVKWSGYQSFGKAKAGKRCPIKFNFSTGEWEGITPQHLAAWAKAYPAVNLDLFLKHMAQWQMSNPARRKSDYCRALTNWLKKEQDRGGFRHDLKSAAAYGISKKAAARERIMQRARDEAERAKGERR